MMTIERSGVHNQNRDVREIRLKGFQQNVNPHKREHLANAGQQQDMDAVTASHDKMLEEKRGELLEVVRQCMADIHAATTSGSDVAVRPIILKADEFYAQKKQRIAETRSLALLDGMMPPMWTYKDDTLRRIEGIVTPKPAPTPNPNPGPVKLKKMIKPIYRQSIFPAKRLESEDEINAYVEQMRKQLLAYMKGSDGIDLK